MEEPYGSLSVDDGPPISDIILMSDPPPQCIAKKDHISKCAFEWLGIDKLELAGDVWIAGGYCRSVFAREPRRSDIDIFFSNPEKDGPLVMDAIGKVDDDFETIIENDTVSKLRVCGKAVDVVLKKYDGIQHCLSTFDFTVACIGITRSGEIWHHKTFWQDLASRSLVVNHLPHPVGTIRRMQKYIKKGYRICNGGIMKIAEAVKDRNLPTADGELYVD